MRVGRSQGFIYAALLFALAVVAVGSAVFASVWSQQVQREREQALMDLGRQWVEAIGAYYENSPGSIKHYPADVSALLEDDRQVQLRRYLRTIPFDPMTGSDDWGLVRAFDGGIMGVYSRSTLQPLRHGDFPDWVEVRGRPGRYVDMRFIYQPKG